MQEIVLIDVEKKKLKYDIWMCFNDDILTTIFANRFPQALFLLQKIGLYVLISRYSEVPTDKVDRMLTPILLK